MNKKGVEFTFSWIFAIVAGAVILVSAIYLTTRFIDSGRTEGDTFIAGELANLLNPIETNLEDVKYSVIDFSRDTRIYNECSAEGTFGVQRLSTSSKSGNEWNDKSVRKSVFNKYLFSRNVEETDDDKLYVMVRPFVEPFKIGDLIIIHGGNYCFVNPDSNTEEFIRDISADLSKNVGINISLTTSSCPKNSTIVCFDKIGCDINVNTRSEVVSKSGKDLYYRGDSLQLAAIFSEPEIYECQLKRLMKRAGELAVVYSKKAVYVEGNGCSNNLVGDLQDFVLMTNITDSKDFSRAVVPLAENLYRRNNELASCKIF
mgnify:CR=1 FL=1